MDKSQIQSEFNALSLLGFTYEEIAIMYNRTKSNIGIILKGNHDFDDMDENADQKEIDLFMDYFYYLGFDKLFSKDILHEILKNLHIDYNSEENERELMRKLLSKRLISKKLLKQKLLFNNCLTVILRLLKQAHNSNIEKLDAHELLYKYFNFKAIILEGDAKTVFMSKTPRGIESRIEERIDVISYEDTYKREDRNSAKFCFHKCCEIIGWHALLTKKLEGKQAWNGINYRVTNMRHNDEDRDLILHINAQTCGYTSLLGTNFGIMKNRKLIENFYSPDSRTTLSDKIKKMLNHKDLQGELLKLDERKDIQENLDFLDKWPTTINNKELWEYMNTVIDKELKYPSNLAESFMANLLSVNVTYITHDDHVIIQERGGYSGHLNDIKYQTSAAGFVKCRVNSKLDNDYKLELDKAITDETFEEMGKSINSKLKKYYNNINIKYEDASYYVLGTVRDKTNYEVGIMVLGILSEDLRDFPVNAAMEHNHSEVDGYYFVRFDPKSVFKFILNDGSNREGTREPWNDIMPLGAASILFALANRYDWDIMKKEWNDCFEQWSKYGKVK